MYEIEFTTAGKARHKILTGDLHGVSFDTMTVFNIKKNIENTSTSIVFDCLGSYMPLLWGSSVALTWRGGI